MAAPQGKALRLPDTALEQKLEAEKAFSKALLEENNKIKSAMKRLRKELTEKEKLIQDSSPSSTPNFQLDMQAVMAFLLSHGGLSRFTILDDGWHGRNPHACLQLFGFKTWKECKETIEKKFPEIFLEAPQIYRSKKNLIDMGEATDFEKCLCVKFMDRTGMTAGRTALLFGRDKRTIVKWKEKWCPKWGIERHQQGMDKDGGATGRSKSSKRAKTDSSNPTSVVATDMGTSPTDLANLLGQPPIQLPPMMTIPTPLPLHQMAPARHHHHHHPDDYFASPPSRRHFGGV